MKPAIHVVAALGIGLALAAGCGKGDFSQRGQKGKENVFRYPIVTKPTTLDPHIVQDGDTIDVIQNVYEGLVGWGTNNQVIPVLAERWDVQDDGTTYVFKLKKGVKFHNGRELVADDVKFGIERACTPELKSTTAKTYLADIVGVTDKIERRAREVKGVQVVDPYTVKIQIDKPRPYFLGKLTYPASFPVPKESVPSNSEMRELSQMIGTGPYRLENYVPSQLVVLAAFKDYHMGAPKVDKIERPVVPDAATRLNKYKGGEIDLVMLERQDVLALQKDPALKDHLQFFPRPSIWYIGLNLKEYAPFAKRDVRRAFAMAIDREKIVREELSGINQVANSIVPPDVFGHRPKANAIAYNPAQARALLAKAGYPGGRGMPPLTMYFREQRTDIRIVAESAAAQLKENLGVDVQLKTLEWRHYLERHSADKLPFFHMRWAADYLDAENFLSLLLAGYGGENHVNYRNPEFDALCSKADSSQDPEERKRLYAQAEDIVLQDAPFIPIYFQRDAELISPRVKDLEESLFGHLPHRKVRLAD